MVINRIINIFGRVFLPRVRDLMTKGFTTLDEKAPLIDAFQAVMKNDIRSIVITREGKPVGILTRRDLLTKCFFDQTYFNKTTVGDVMSQPLITISPNENVLKAVELMTQMGIRRLVVVEGDKVVGRILLEEIKHLTSESSVTVFYRMAYFLFGVLATLVMFAIALAL